MDVAAFGTANKGRVGPRIVVAEGVPKIAMPPPPGGLVGFKVGLGTVGILKGCLLVTISNGWLCSGTIEPDEDVAELVEVINGLDDGG